MQLSESQRESMRKYLLGTLPEPEQTALEDEYLNDDEGFEQMVAAENELVDGYVRGQLTRQERRQFEQHYLAHPARRERVSFARALHTRIDQQPELSGANRQVAERPAWRQKLLDVFRAEHWQLNWAAALALLLLALGIGAFYLFNRPAPNARDVVVRETPMPTTPSPVTQPSVMPTPIAPDKPSPVFASLILTVGGLRGEGEGKNARVTLAANVDFVRLQLNIRRQDYPRYSILLRSGSGAEIWRRQGIKSKVGAAKEQLTVDIPANKLAAGAYLLTLSGVTKEGERDEIGKSSFQVARK